MNIILLRGAPLSGKTTWAKQAIEDGDGAWKRIAKDDLRYMSDNDNRYGVRHEAFYTKMRNILLDNYLKEGYNVIVDETFAQLSSIQEIVDNHEEHHSIFILDNYFEDDLFYLERRDIARALRTNRARIGAVELENYLKIIKSQPIEQLRGGYDVQAWGGCREVLSLAQGSRFTDHECWKTL